MSEDESAIEDAKRILRRRLRTERAGRGPEWAASRAHALAANLQELTRSLEARAISAYLSTPDEPDTRAFLTWAAEEGIRVLLPIIRPDGLLDWAEHDGTETIEATLGMPEPTADALAPTELESVTVLAPVPGRWRDGRWKLRSTTLRKGFR